MSIEWGTILINPMLAAPAGMGGNVTIGDMATESAPILVAGMTSGGHVDIGMIAPTGTPTETIFWVVYFTGEFIVHCSTPPGVGQAYNLRWTAQRLS